MLKSGLLTILEFLSTLRGWIAQLNGWLPHPLTEQQLYCLLFGLLGLGLYFLVHPVIRHLARRGSESVISWAYALTLLLSLLLVVEISRLVTDGSSISPEQILYAVGGFLALSAVYLLVYLIVQIIQKLARRRKRF